MADSKRSTGTGGWIYAATDGRNVKVGCTIRTDLEQRMRVLAYEQRRARMWLLQAVHVSENVLRVEACVHRILREHCIRDEWFDSDVLQTPLQTLVEQALVLVNQPVVKKFKTYCRKNPVVIDDIYQISK
jgi:Meiotically up-regulated gene 113